MKEKIILKGATIKLGIDPMNLTTGLISKSKILVTKLLSLSSMKASLEHRIFSRKRVLSIYPPVDLIFDTYLLLCSWQMPAKMDKTKTIRHVLMAFR